ncbi:MAG: hypothetical protein U5K75_09290 [Ahrensia sp.]|nr:hypothetical protein [Ahrensia sp.]
MKNSAGLDQLLLMLVPNRNVHQTGVSRRSKGVSASDLKNANALDPPKPRHPAMLTVLQSGEGSSAGKLARFE